MMRRTGIHGNGSDGVLLNNRQERTERKRRRAEPSSRARLAVIASVVLVTAATPAFAVNEPQLLSTFPASGAAVRHGDVIDVTALYDRDLDEETSGFQLLDAASTPVPGWFYLAGSRSETGGYRTAAFHPESALTEAAGPYTAKIKARASVPADPTYTTFTFSIDDTAPAPPVFTEPLTGQVRTEQPVIARGSAEPGATVVIVEGMTVLARDRANETGAFTIPLPFPFEDGITHSIYAEAIDAAGNVGAPSATVTFSHDSIVRVPVIRFPTEGLSVNTTNVTVRGDAKPDTAITLEEGGSTIATTTADETGAWSVPVTFAAGAHTITATSWDGVFYDGPSEARAFTIDLTPPGAPIILTPAAGAQLNDGNVTITGTAEPGATVRLRHGGVLRATVAVSPSGTWSATLPFADGTHTISATVLDAATNESAASSRQFTVDTVAPAMPVITSPTNGAFVNTNPVTLNGSAEAGSTVRLLEGTVQVGSTIAGGSGAWSMAVSFSQAAHSVRAVAVDAAQNESPSSAFTSFTVDTTPPGAPAITSPASSSTVFTAEVRITGTAEPGSSVFVKEGAITIASAAANGSGDWTTTVTMTNGAHTITARAVDAATNLGPASVPVSFTVSASTDVTPPGAPTLIDPAESSLQRGFVRFNGVAEPLSTVRIYEGAVQRLSGTADASGNVRLGLTMLSGVHTVTATATDRAGNTSAATPARTFTVDDEIPTVAFTTTSGTLWLLTEQTIITGVAGDNLGVDHVVLEYRDIQNRLVLRANANVCSGCPGPSVTWEARPSLPPNIYAVQATAIDLAGNASEPASITIYRL